MRYDDSILVENLAKFSHVEDIDKFIRFPHLNVKPLHLTELIASQFHWNGLKSIYLFSDSKIYEIDDEFSDAKCFNIVAIDRDNDLYLFKDEIDFYVYLEHDTYLAALRAQRYEVKRGRNESAHRKDT